MFVSTKWKYTDPVNVLYSKRNISNLLYSSFSWPHFPVSQPHQWESHWHRSVWRWHERFHRHSMFHESHHGAPLDEVDKRTGNVSRIKVCGQGTTLLYMDEPQGLGSNPDCVRNNCGQLLHRVLRNWQLHHPGYGRVQSVRDLNLSLSSDPYWLACESHIGKVFLPHCLVSWAVDRIV